MLTPNEMQRILDQINVAFDAANKRIDQLEDKIANLEEAKKTPRKQT